MSNESLFKRENLPEILLIILIGVLIVSICVLAFTPPVSKDALTHHLNIPKLYLKYGGIYEIPTMNFSYYPMNLDLLYIIPIYFGNDIIPKYIHFFFAILTACLIFGYLRYRLNTGYALLGVAFFLSVPIVVKLSISVYVDLGLIFFSTASLLSILKWIEHNFKFKWLIVSAICCGFALGIKYNGLISFLLLSLFIPLIYSKYSRNDHQRSLGALKYGVIFFLMSLLIFSPWMIRNYIWTDNPIYPLYDSIFNHQSGMAKASLGVFGSRAILYNESWWEIALVPLRIFFQGQDGNPQFFDGKLNPFLIIFSIIAFFQFSKDSIHLKREKKIFLIFSILYFAFALFSSGMRIRYISPIIPPMVILSIFGLKKVFEIFVGFRLPVNRNLRALLVLFMILFLFSININYIFGQFNYVKPFDYLNGTLTREEYIEKFRPEYAAMKYINNELSSNAHILFIFMGNRGYYCDRDYVFDMIKNKSTLRQLVIYSNNTDQILLGLKRMKITHLVMHDGLFNKWVKTNFESSDQQLLFTFLQKHLESVFSKHEYSVFRLEEN